MYNFFQGGKRYNVLYSHWSRTSLTFLGYEVQKVKPKHLRCPLVAGCSIDRKSSQLVVCRKHFSQTSGLIFVHHEDVDTNQR